MFLEEKINVLDLDKSILDEASVEMAKVLTVIPPKNLRDLAMAFGKIPGMEKRDVVIIQGDILKLADMSEKALIKIRGLCGE